MIYNQRILPNIEDVGGFVEDLRTKKPQCRNHSSIFSNVGFLWGYLTKLNKSLSQWRLTTKKEMLPNQSSQRIFPEIERIKWFWEFHISTTSTSIYWDWWTTFFSTNENPWYLLVHHRWNGNILQVNLILMKFLTFDSNTPIFKKKFRETGAKLKKMANLLLKFSTL